MSQATKVLFMGSKQLGLSVLREIISLSPETLAGVLTIDDRDDTRTVLSGFQKFSDDNGVPLLVAKSRKHSEEIINELRPDLCLVVGWYWLIAKTVLDAVPRGFIGIHNSLLPKFRGGSPLIWTIMSGEKDVGFSIFSFTPGMDDGAVWAQGRVVVEESDYISDVIRKLEEETIRVLRKTYVPILNGTIHPVEQKHELATYCAQRFPFDGNIDWHKSARDVYNFIRAQSDPYPGAFTFCGGGKVKIWKARYFESTYYGVSGQVARVSSDGVYVICGGNGAVILDQVEVSGKKGIAADFIKSIKTRLSNTVHESMVETKS